VAPAIYSLCALTAGLCAFRLLAAYRGARYRLLFWGGICFVGLAVNNALLVVDRVLLPDVNLFTLRLVTGLLGIMALLYGLIWDSE
jgi:hypothetical protein